MVYKFFDEKTGSGMSVLAKELRKPVAKKFKRRRVYARFKDKIGQQFQLKWNYCLQIIKIVSIFYV